MKVKVDLSHLNLDSSDFEKLRSKSVDVVSKRVRRNLIKNTPADKGLARASYRIEKTENTAIITNLQHYLPFVNDGTGIYGPFGRRIKPVRAKVLHWEKNGQHFFAKSVRGQRPQKFVEKSIEETSEQIEGLIIRAAKEVI